MKEVRLIPYQKKFSYSYSLGVFPTIELMEKHPSSIIKIIFHSRGKQNKGVKRLFDFCLQNKVKTEWNDGLIKKVGGNDNTYAVGVFEKYSNSLKEGNNHLVLVNPEDSGNLGTMVRTALAFDIFDIAIIRPAVDSFDPRTVRASMGAVFTSRIEYFESFNEYQLKYKNSCFVFVTRAKKELSGVNFKRPYSLVFGSESFGLGKEYTGIGESVGIKQTDNVDSLNLAIAAGIAMYQASKQ